MLKTPNGASDATRQQDVAEVSSTYQGRLKRHLVLVGPPVWDPGDWVTACGWKFGTGSAARADSMHMQCKKCLRSRWGGGWGG